MITFFIKRTKISIILILIVVISGCVPGEKCESERIDLTQNNPASIYDIFSEVRVVQLETKKENLMSGIGKAEFYKGHYYIVDSRGREFFCFDENGKFVFKISAFGRGPGEYNFIGAFTVDRFNEEFIILDPPSQKVLIFDLNGRFIEEKTVATNDIMGYFRVFSLNDSTLLLTSMNNFQLVFYCRKKENVIHKSFPILYDMGPFTPYTNVYQSGNFTYVLPALKQHTMNISEVTPVKHFEWCFGENNNNAKQINNVQNKLKNNDVSIQEMYSHEAVSENGLLNHWIIWIHETTRFKIALIEFDNKFKHVIIDKKKNKINVFDNFKEEVSIALSNLNQNNVINFENNGYFYFKNIGRNMSYFNVDYLSNDCRKLIEDHDIETDNPFLVVYTFKE